MCLDKPAEYANNLVKAGGNFTAHDLRNKTESIRPSQVEAIKASMKERDTKIEVSQRFDPGTWLEVEGNNLDDALDAICENAGLSRRIEKGDMLITKPRPPNNDPLCLAIEGYDSYPKALSLNAVNAVLDYDEKFGPVLEVAYNFLGIPTLAVRVPWFPP